MEQVPLSDQPRGDADDGRQTEHDPVGPGRPHADERQHDRAGDPGERLDSEEAPERPESTATGEHAPRHMLRDVRADEQDESDQEEDLTVEQPVDQRHGRRERTDDQHRGNGDGDDCGLSSYRRAADPAPVRSEMARVTSCSTGNKQLVATKPTLQSTDIAP